MFNLLGGLPDMGEMVKTIGEYKALFERYVVAAESNNKKLDAIIAHLGIAPAIDNTDVVDAEFTEGE